MLQFEFSCEKISTDILTRFSPLSYYCYVLNHPFSIINPATLSLSLFYCTSCLPCLLWEGIHLQTSSGVIWSPVLVIEPSGGANVSFPRRQLFTRLKHKFFRHAHRIQVRSYLTPPLFCTCVHPTICYTSIPYNTLLRIKGSNNCWR